MATNVGSLMAYIGLDTSELDKGLKRAEKNVDSTSKTIEKTLSTLKKTATALFAGWGAYELGQELYDVSVSVDSMRLSMDAALGSVDLAQKSMQFLREESDRLGLVFKDQISNFQKLSASAKGTSLEGEETRQIFLGIAEAATALQMTQDQVSGSMYAVAQMMSKGKVQAEELRGQLGERLPGAFNLAAEAMGMTTAELSKALEMGEVYAEDLLPKFADALRTNFGEAATEAAEGLRSSVNKMKNAIFDLEKSFVESSGYAEGLQGAVDGLTGVIEEFGNKMPSIVSSLENMAELIAGTAIYLTFGTVVTGVGAAFTWAAAEMAAFTSTTVVMGQEITIANGVLATFKTQTTASIAEIGLLKIAVGGLFAAFAGYQIGQMLYDNFETARLAGLAFVDSVMSGWISLKTTFKTMWVAIEGTWTDGVNVLETAFGNFLSAVATALSYIPHMSTETINSIQKMADTLKSSGGEAYDFAGAMQTVKDEAKAEKEAHDEIINALILQAQNYDATKKKSEGFKDATTETRKEARKTAEAIADALDAEQMTANIEAWAYNSKTVIQDWTDEISKYFEQVQIDVDKIDMEQWVKNGSKAVDVWRDNAIVSVDEVEKEYEAMQLSYETIVDNMSTKDATYFAAKAWLIEDDIANMRYAGVEAEAIKAAEVEMWKEYEREKALASDDFFAGLSQAMKDLAEESETNAQIMYDAFEGFATDTSDAWKTSLSDYIKGDISSISEAFSQGCEDMVDALADALADMAIKWAAAEIWDLVEDYASTLSGVASSVSSVFGWDHLGDWYKSDTVLSYLKQGEMVLPTYVADIVREKYDTFDDFYYDVSQAVDTGEGSATLTNLFEGNEDAFASWVSGSIIPFYSYVAEYGTAAGYAQYEGGQEGTSGIESDSASWTGAGYDASLSGALDMLGDMWDMATGQAFVENMALGGEYDTGQSSLSNFGSWLAGLMTGETSLSDATPDITTSGVLTGALGAIFDIAETIVGNVPAAFEKIIKGVLGEEVADLLGTPSAWDKLREKLYPSDSYDVDYGIDAAGGYYTGGDFETAPGAGVGGYGGGYSGDLGEDEDDAEMGESGYGGYALGGIATGVGPHTELLHNTEAVVPLPDGRTIPVTLTGNEFTGGGSKGQVLNLHIENPFGEDIIKTIQVVSDDVRVKAEELNAGKTKIYYG